MIDKAIVILYVCTVVPCILILPNAFAHQLLENQDPETNYHIIPDFLNNSWFILEETEPPMHKHFVIEGMRGDVVESLQVLIPDIPNDPQIRDYTFRITDLEDEEFEIIYEPTLREFHEPFSDTNWFVIYDVDFELPEDGQYRIHVIPNSDISGKFSLAVGVQENFTVEDFIFDTPLTILKMKAFFNDVMFFLILGLGLILSAVIIITLVHKKK